jgi:hypothetical protein
MKPLSRKLNTEKPDSAPCETLSLMLAGPLAEFLPSSSERKTWIASPMADHGTG